MDNLVERLSTCQTITKGLFDALDGTLESRESLASARVQCAALMEQLNLLEEKLGAANILHLATVPPLDDGTKHIHTTLIARHAW